jgi:predicted nucleic acid-binding protein
MTELHCILDRTPTIRADNDVIDAHATLYAECRRTGHALYDKRHTGDRWVAACAIGKGVPLLAGDGIYRNAPGLTLLDEVADD